MTSQTFLYLSRSDVIAACQHVDSILEMREVFALHASGDRKGPLDPAQAMQRLAGQNIEFLPLIPSLPDQNR